MVVLFSESYKAYYYAPVVSFPFCVTFITLIFCVLTPFFLQFSSEKFWYPIDREYEHPIIRFKDEYIINLLDVTGEVTTISSFSKLNKQNDDQPFISSVNIIKNEINNDDVYDSLNLKCIVTKNPDAKYTGIKVILFFDYIITKIAKYHFQSFVIASGEHNLGITGFETRGELKLYQKVPFYVGDYTNETYKEDYFEQGHKSIDFDDLYKNFTNRDYYTYYDYIKKIKPFLDDSTISIDVKVEIPSYQEILYYQPHYMNLKFKWIQYFAIFIPTFIVCKIFIQFILKNRVFNVSMESDLPKEIN